MKTYSKSFNQKHLINNALLSVNFEEIKEFLVGKKFDVVDFFAGCGGMSYGFHAIGNKTGLFRHVAAFDIDKHANATFATNFGNKPFDIDLKSASPLYIKKTINACRKGERNPLVVIGCAPCQGFSKHRKKDPSSKKDPRNFLVSKLADIALELEPFLIIMENVPEVISKNYKSHYEPFKNKLEEKGYTVKAQVINMADFGVPQKRERALVLASKHCEVSFPDKIFTEESYLTVKDAIGNLPKLKSGKIDRADLMHETSKHRKETISILEKVPHNGGSRPKGVGPACLDKVKGFYDVYGRLHWGKPSITITARCRTPSCGRFAHPEQNRGLSIREAALLQGFPKEFMFEGPFDDKFKQIGNAVPPIFSLYLAAHILKMISMNTNPVQSAEKSERLEPVSF